MTGVQQGNINRKWRGYWKIHPDQHEKIALDHRKADVIAQEYNVARSYISRIKRDYRIKNNLCMCNDTVAYYIGETEMCAGCNKKTK